MKNKIHKPILLGLLGLGISLSACKQEPQYRIKEPFGKSTLAGVDGSNFDEVDPLRIPKRYIDRDKVKERKRKQEFTKKKFREARNIQP